MASSGHNKFVADTAQTARIKLDPSDFLDIDSQLSDEERLIRETVRKFVGDRVQSDDICLACFGRNG